MDTLCGFNQLFLLALAWALAFLSKQSYSLHFLCRA